MTGSYDAQELPSRMARVLADGTGAEWSQVWLVVGGRLQLAATWPPDATDREPVLDPAAATTGTDDQGRVRRSLPVLEAGELLGALVVREREHRPLSSVESRLFAGLADQAGPVLRGARLHAELTRRLEELSTRARELRISRQRLVAAQDAERRILERDIHDGAQQHLVALAVNLRLAETLSHRSRERADALLAEQEHAAAEAIEVLVALSRGIYPRRLGADGLVAALTTAVAGERDPGRGHGHGRGQVLRRASRPRRTSAAWRRCRTPPSTRERPRSGSPSTDAAVGWASWSRTTASASTRPPPTTGTGLANLRDRIESAGGTLTTGTAPGGGTRIRARLPALVGAGTGPAGERT